MSHVYAYASENTNKHLLWIKFNKRLPHLYTGGGGG